MALFRSSVLKLYHTVIEDVISSVRDEFLEEVVDEQVLIEMKEKWCYILMSSKAVGINPEQSEPQPPQIMVNNLKTSAAEARRQAVKAAAAQHNNSSAIVITSSAGTNVDIKPGIAANAGSGNSISAQQQTSPTGPLPIVATLDPCGIVPFNITLPGQPETHNTERRLLTIDVPATALQENQFKQIFASQVKSSVMSFPTTLANSALQEHFTVALQNVSTEKLIPDEAENDVSDDNIDGNDEDIDKNEDEDKENKDEAEGESFNSRDDISDEDSTDTDNNIDDDNIDENDEDIDKDEDTSNGDTEW